VVRWISNLFFFVVFFIFIFGWGGIMAYFAG